MSVGIIHILFLMLLSDTILENLQHEFNYTTSRSSGPGGQNVNKVNTKVEVRFNIALSQVLSIEQKQLVFSRLSNKLSTDGELIITCQEERSQLKNKQIATQKMLELIQRSLVTRKKRKPSRPTKSSVEKRLQNKKRRSLIKQNRKITDL